MLRSLLLISVVAIATVNAGPVWGPSRRSSYEEESLDGMEYIFADSESENAAFYDAIDDEDWFTGLRREVLWKPTPSLEKPMRMFSPSPSKVCKSHSVPVSSSSSEDEEGDRWGIPKSILDRISKVKNITNTFLETGIKIIPPSPSTTEWPDIPGLVDGPNDTLAGTIKINVSPILLQAVIPGIITVLERHIDDAPIDDLIQAYTTVPVLGNISFSLANLKMTDLIVDRKLSGIILQDGHVDVYASVKSLTVKTKYSIRRVGWPPVRDTGFMTIKVSEGHVHLGLKAFTNRRGGITCILDSENPSRTVLQTFHFDISHDSTVLDLPLKLVTRVFMRLIRAQITSAVNQVLDEFVPGIVSEMIPHQFPFNVDLLEQKYTLSAAAVGSIDITPNGIFTDIAMLFDDFQRCADADNVPPSIPSPGLPSTSKSLTPHPKIIKRDIREDKDNFESDDDEEDDKPRINIPRFADTQLRS